MSPKSLYRALALAEVGTWTLLLAGMFLKYVTDTTEVLVRIGGGVHGFVFLAYGVATVLIAVDRRWTLPRLVAGLGSAVVPYLTIPFERSVERAGLLGESWRLLEEQPCGFVERTVVGALRRPILAAAVTVIVLAVVFSGLLMAGPPTEWGQ